MNTETEVWLIGVVAEHLPHSKLPLNVDVLKCVFYRKLILNESNKLALANVTRRVIDLWTTSGILTIAEQNISKKIARKLAWYDLLKKNKGRQSQISRENSFMEYLFKFFDVCKPNLKLPDESISFLLDQRTVRELKIKSLHSSTILTAPSKKLKAKKKINRIRKRDHLNIEDALDSDLAMEIEVDDDTKDIDFEDTLPHHQKAKLVPKQESIIDYAFSPDVTSTLDRINLSSGKFVILAAAMARSGKNRISTLSRSTSERRRQKNRFAISESIRSEFIAEAKAPIVVHFDGKSLKEYSNNEKQNDNGRVERLGIVATGLNMEQVLGVTKSADGCGKTIANEVNKLLQEWQIKKKICGMSFDTTSANTGRLKGACKILETKLKRNLLNFACRHHIHELIISGVFEALFGATSGPNVPVFQQFKLSWRKIDKTKYKPLDAKIFNSTYLKKLRKDTIGFLKQALENKGRYVLRDDYREVIELSLLILGEHIPNYKFKLPGALHHARWMAKIIYSFKIYLFRDQFKLDATEINNFKEFCLFGSLIYVKAWLQSPFTSDAPINDLELYENLQKYSKVNDTVSVAAKDKLQNHLWYLGAELVVLALFSKKTTITEKRKMVEKMKQKGANWSTRATRLTENDKPCRKKLVELIDCQSLAALQSMKLDIEFVFEVDPAEWKDLAAYNLAKTTVDAMKVVNDPAERSLALMTTYNESLTKDEAQKQAAIQVVADHRKRLKKFTKKTLISYKRRK